MTEERGIGVSRMEVTVFFCTVVGITNAFGVYLFSVLIPEMKASLGVSLEFIGFATALGQAGVMVGSLVCGVITNRVGALRLVFAGSLICTLSLIGMSLVERPWIAAVLLLLLGVSAAAVWVCVVVATRALIAKEHQGKSLGMMASTGTALGVFLAGLFVPTLIALWGWRSVWVTVGAFALLVHLFGYLRLRHLISILDRTRPSEEARVRRPSLISAVASRAGLILLSMSLLNGLTFIPFQTYLTSLLQSQFSWDSVQAKACWSIIGVGSALGGVVFGYLSDRISAKTTLAIAYALLAVATAGAQIGFNHPVFYSAVLLFGLAYGAVFGQTAAYITKTQDAQGSAVLSGATYVGFGLGSTIGNFAIGAYAESSGDFLDAFKAVSLGILMLVGLTLLLRGDGRPLSDPVAAQ